MTLASTVQGFSSASAAPAASGPGATCNICGLVVHVRADRESALRVEIGALSGVEIHAEGGAGRLVVTAMDEGGTTALEQIAAINRLPGVVATSLVYHALDVAD